MSKIIKLTQLGNVAVIPVKPDEDFDYALYNNDGRYIAKRISPYTPNQCLVEFVVYDYLTTHRCVGDKFNLWNTTIRWTRYRIADKSSPTIEDIKKHLQF